MTVEHEALAARLTAALTMLARRNIPTDVQELLIQGDPKRGIAPGALGDAVEHAAPSAAPVVTDDWIEWTGGMSPVPFCTAGYLRIADGEEFHDSDIGSFNWRHDHLGPVPERRIIAYRLAARSEAK